MNTGLCGEGLAMNKGLCVGDCQFSIAKWLRMGLAGGKSGTFFLYSENLREKVWRGDGKFVFLPRKENTNPFNRKNYGFFN